MKLLVIHNLSAGYGDGSIYDYIRMVAADGDEQCIRYSDGTTDVASLVWDAQEYDCVVVSGGDGTIAAVTYALADTGIPILPFPAGTANLLTNNLLAPIEAHALAKMTRDMRTLDFDLGEIESHGHRYGFCIMAGAGYDAKIMHDAKPAKKTWGPMAYFQAAVANTTPQKSHIKLVLDGNTVESEGLGVVLVNFSKIQFEITVTHDNKPRDGALEVVILKAENAFGLIPALFAGLRDRDGEYPDRTDSLEIHRAREIYAEADPPLQIQYDGEVPNLTTPFHARVLDGATRFVLSEPGYDYFSNQD